MPALDFERLSPLLVASAVAMRALSGAALKAQAVIVASPDSTADELRKSQRDVAAILSYQAELVDLVQLGRYALSLSLPPELHGWQPAQAVAAIEAIHGAEANIADAANARRFISAKITAFLEAIIADEPIPEGHRGAMADFASIADGPEHFADKVMAFCNILISARHVYGDENEGEEGQDGAVEYVNELERP